MRACACSDGPGLCPYPLLRGGCNAQYEVIALNRWVHPKGNYLYRSSVARVGGWVRRAVRAEYAKRQAVDGSPAEADAWV